MKSLLASLLLLLPLVVVVPAKEITRTPNLKMVCSMPYWRPDAKVSVYFIRAMFTSDQRQALLDAMGSSELTAAKLGVAVTFSYAGETDGLIDCESCLTVGRQGIYDGNRKSQSGLNSLRRNDRGELISAWIGIDPSITSYVALRGYMLQALRSAGDKKPLLTCNR